MREMLTDIVSSDPGLEVVGVASDPVIARRKIARLRPDVMTLDIDMQRMDGLTFLEELMAEAPMPVVVISGVTQESSEAMFRALSLGAVDVIPKSKVNIDTLLSERREEITAKVRAAAETVVRPVKRARPGPEERTGTGKSDGLAPDRRIVFIGASAGGLDAIEVILRRLAPPSPPILLVQHMPREFTGKFAARMDGVTDLRVKEAEDGEPVLSDRVYIAPGGVHLELARTAGRFVCRLSETEPVSGHRPSVDVLFQSAARLAPGISIGVILSGMGKDGAEGLLAPRSEGGATIGQDEETALVYGMPRVAFETGAVEHQLGLDMIPDKIRSLRR